MALGGNFSIRLPYTPPLPISTERFMEVQVEAEAEAESRHNADMLLAQHCRRPWRELFPLERRERLVILEVQGSASACEV